jgi:DNA (cytosine-5)-methyltransferase 1
MLKVVDLFCGCGGASLGFELAGCEVVAAVDIDSEACSTYARNIGHRPLQGDLTRLSYHGILAHHGLDGAEPEILAGCPPCQAFSSLRRTRTDPSAGEKDALLVAFVRLIREALPRVVVFENVPGILSLEKGKYLKYYLRRVEELGYATAYDIVNAADYGVPQFRKRVVAFSVLDVDREDLSFPAPTHARPDASPSNGTKPWVTVRDAISDLPPLEQGQVDPTVPNHSARSHGEKVLRMIEETPKDGGSRRDIPRKLWLPCHKRLNGRGAESVYGRLSWDQPSTTMTTRCATPSSGRFLHPDQDRGISPREAARLQTFPDAFVFPQVVRTSERQIGNAVPPSLFHVLVDGFFRDNRSVA